MVSFFLYNEWKDRLVFIMTRTGDSLRRYLHSRNVLTHKVDARLNVDVYYMYNDVHDDYPRAVTPASVTIRSIPVSACTPLVDVSSAASTIISITGARPPGRRNNGQAQSGHDGRCAGAVSSVPGHHIRPRWGLIAVMTGDKSDTRKVKAGITDDGMSALARELLRS